MGLDKRLLEILCCPVSKQPVAMLSGRQLDALKQAAVGGSVKHVDGSALEKAPEAGLLTRDGKLIYLIDDGIPVMLADQAVETSQIDSFPRSP